ncbi:MAG: primosomal protein N' [Deltaproteobacteria bacterium]|nr:primosomal protein N' [Deltaproteobacteria bacterium]
MKSFCSVLLFSAPFSTLTYAVPRDLPPEMWVVGARVLVPLGRGTRLGILTGFVETAPPGVNARDVLWPVDRVPMFRDTYLDFIRDLSIRQMDAPGLILARVLPAGVRETPEFRDNNGGRVPIQDLIRAAEPRRRALTEAWLTGALTLAEPRRIRERLYSLVSEPPWPIRPQATAQIEILRYLDLHGVSSAKVLHAHFGKNLSQPLGALLKKGLVIEVESRLAETEPSVPRPVPVQLNPAQTEAVDGFERLLQSDRAESALLFGVTGSGKTAVYLELTKRCLLAGRHVMLLAPEVAIALKLHTDVRAVLPDVPVVLSHGYLGPGQRQRAFMDLVGCARPHVIVGTRSCLFLPVEPGLVILDEEHDASFKQDEGLVYQARELAFGRIARSRGLLLMGSATPDIKVFHAAKSQDIALARLDQRAGPAELPEVRLIDLRSDPPAHGPFAASAHAEINETLARGDQVIILHNRRGYAPILYCESCSEPLKCPHCQVSMTFHKRRELALCHYCGYSLPFPVPCPTCQASAFLPLGAGTERLEEFLNQDLPKGVQALRLDRDVSRRASAMQDVLERFARREAQVLVGTQMLSKGLHFPGVTLVVVVDGDLGLNLPDYRATERCFQMLVQVAGRAGRGEKPGRVLIQTRNPRHYCWQFIRHNDYEGFFQKEIVLRKAMGYPPFVKLALVRFSMPVDRAEADFLAVFGRTLRALAQSVGVRVLGPAPAPLAVLRGRKRFQCLLKAENWPVIRGICVELKKLVLKEKYVRLSVDLDPVDML